MREIVSRLRHADARRTRLEIPRPARPEGAVVYCAFEGQAGLRNRVEAFRERKLAEGAGDVPFYLIADAMNLVADHPALIASIRATLGDTKPAAIVLDTLNRSLAGSESDDRDMAAYVKAADAIRDAFNCAVVIVHHCGHEGTRPRGHSSLMGAIDAQIAVKRDAADNIIATVELMKDGPQGEEFASRLEVVELGLDDDGDRITSCVIVPVEGLVPQKEKPKKLPAAAAKALKALHEIIDDAGIIPPHDSYIPPATRAVTVEEWRAHAYKRGIRRPANRMPKNMHSGALSNALSKTTASQSQTLRLAFVRTIMRFRQAGFLRRATARQLLALWHRLFDKCNLSKIGGGEVDGAFSGIVAHEAGDIASAGLHRPNRRLSLGLDNFCSARIFHRQTQRLRGTLWFGGGRTIGIGMLNGVAPFGNSNGFCIFPAVTSSFHAFLSSSHSSSAQFQCLQKS